MNQTHHQKTLNGSLFDSFQIPNHESKPKKYNYIYNTKKVYKQAIFSGINNSIQSNTIFKDNFPSLSKCYSSTKMTKSQHTMYYLSKSFISFPKEDKEKETTSFAPTSSVSTCNKKDKDKERDLIKHHREKSSSTMQSTDERKEIAKLNAELKEKKNMIQSLNKTIDNYIKDKAQYTREITDLRDQLSDYKMENSRLKEEYQYLQTSYDKLKKSIKTINIEELLDKDNREDNKDEVSIKYEEQSLSGICFTDKIKMEKTMNNNESNILPTLDFGAIAGKREPLNIAVTNMKITKPNGNKYNDTMPKYNNTKIHPNKVNSNFTNTNYPFGQKVILGKHIHRSEGNLIISGNMNNYFPNCKK